MSGVLESAEEAQAIIGESSESAALTWPLLVITGTVNQLAATIAQLSTGRLVACGLLPPDC